MTQVLNALLVMMDNIGIKHQRNAQVVCRLVVNVPMEHSVRFVSQAIKETVRQANASVHLVTLTVLLVTVLHVHQQASTLMEKIAQTVQEIVLHAQNLAGLVGLATRPLHF
jgi:hypothetical protein